MYNLAVSSSWVFADPHRNSTPISKSFPHTPSFYVRNIPPYALSLDRHHLTCDPAFKNNDQEVVDFYARSGATPIPGVPKFDSRRVVDGQRSITFLKPIPPTSQGRSFETRSKVLAVYDKGKAGSVVETETVLAERGGDEYSRAVGSAFFVGQGNWGGPKGESS